MKCQSLEGYIYKHYTSVRAVRSYVCICYTAQTWYHKCIHFSFLNVKQAGLELKFYIQAKPVKVSWRQWKSPRSHLSCNLHPPVWMNGREHKNCQNNIQALRREGKAGCLLTDVMDKGMADRLIVLWIGLWRKKNHTKNKTLPTLHSVSYKKHSMPLWRLCQKLEHVLLSEHILSTYYH